MSWYILKAQERFWSKVHKTDTCWIWTGSRWLGYGRFSYNSRNVLAHRVSYMWEHGDPGPNLDHLCRNRACVRPSHLESVTHTENVRRGIPNNGKAARTSCIRGHEYTEENTRWRSDGRGRECRACERNRTHVRAK